MANKKPNLKFLAALWLFSSMCLALTGCATGLASNALIEFCSEADPPVEYYDAAFVYQGDIVLVYTVDRNKSYKARKKYYTQKQPPKLRQHWARLNLHKLSDREGKHYTIHRNALPESKRAKMKQLPLIDLRDHVAITEDGRMDYNAVYDYMKTIPEEDLPQVFIYVQSPSKSSMLVAFMDPSSRKRDTYRNNPFDKYIPAARYPLLLVAYPFAVLGDLITLPFVFMSPGSNM